MRDPDGVFASSLTCRNLPGESHDAVDNRGHTGGDRVAFGALDFKVGRAGKPRGVAIRTQGDCAHIEFLANAIDGLVGRNMGEKRTTALDRNLRRNRSGRRAAPK
jgi:hypothetical protein